MATDESVEKTESATKEKAVQGKNGLKKNGGDGGVKIGSGAINFNKVIVIGEIEAIEIRESGAGMVWVVSSNREEFRIHGASVPSAFTPIIIIRLPPAVVERLDTDAAVPGAIISIEARTQGIKRLVDGKPYYFVEIVAGSAQILANAPEGAEFETEDE